MSGINTLRYPCTAAGILLALALTACGDDSSTDAGNTPSTQNAVMDSNAQTAELPVEPINLAMAYAPLTAQPRSVPVCPWLSDASAAAAVDVVMTDKPMVRRAVTANECKWNVNIGFALSVRAVPLADAGSASAITYNMDNPPVLQPQDGPGSAAVAILDPTWNAEKPRPFGFVFNADNRQFRIITTGVKTSIDRLRAVADEIVAALPTAAAVVEARDAEPTLDPCVYEGASVAVLFNGQTGEAFTQKPYLPASTCRYAGYAGNTRIDLSIAFKGDPLDPPDKLDPAYTRIDGFGTDVYMKDMSRSAGYGSSSRAYQIARPGGQIRVDLKVTEETFPADTAAMILNNLIARTN
ncbi:MAG: hypothetical protein WBN96_13090 [Gammaproteobacteria bacterium]